jgi:hypothetical protein
MASASSTMLATIPTAKITVGSGLLKPSEAFSASAHTTSKAAAENSRIHVMTSPFRVGRVVVQTGYGAHLVRGAGRSSIQSRPRASPVAAGQCRWHVRDRGRW